MSYMELYFAIKLWGGLGFFVFAVIVFIIGYTRVGK